MIEATIPSQDLQVLEAFDRVTSKLSARWLITGAWARMLLEQFHDLPRGRATMDIDIGIALQSWDSFLIIRQMLRDEHGWQTSEQVAHRLFHPNGRQLDLVPFGAIADEQMEIQWPGGEWMTVAGYGEAYANAVEVRFNDCLEGRSVDAVGFLVLKFFAWKDRRLDHSNHGKDASDIAFILRHAEAIIGTERLYEDHMPAIEAADYDLDLAATAVLGHEVRKMAGPKTLAMLEVILADLDQSQLVRETGAHFPGGRATALAWLAAFYRGLRSDA